MGRLRLDTIDKKDLSIIIPAFNEEKIIYKNLEKTNEALKNILQKHGYTYEIIVVDDGSTDNTYKEALNASENIVNIKVVNYKKNGGKGKALKYGFKYCNARYVTFIDADLDLHPNQISHFIEYMEESNADVVIGSKRHPLSIINYPTSRKVLSGGYHLLTRLLFHLDLSDTQTGLKLFKYEVLKEILPRILCKKYAFDLELLVNVKTRGWKITEAPIELNWQRANNRLKLQDMWHLGLDTAAIFYRLKIKKHYQDRQYFYHFKLLKDYISVKK